MGYLIALIILPPALRIFVKDDGSDDKPRDVVELLTCTRGEGLLKVGNETAILEIRPTEREFSFIETNVNKLAEQRNRNA